jgi:uracil-DNA glycosylase
MALDLSKRQIAMLAEMGVRVWSPPQMRVQVIETEKIAQLNSRAESIQPIAPSTWDGLEAAVRSCRTCGLCGQENGAWALPLARTASWMVVLDMPAGAGAMNADEEQLLDGMLKAVGRSRSGEGEQGAYVTAAVKCRPSSGKGPGEAEIEACRAHLRQEVVLLQPRVILGLGRYAARALISTLQPLGALRGHVHQFEGVPLVVTYPVAYLLRHPLEKAKAWADLCLAAETGIRRDFMI